MKTSKELKEQRATVSGRIAELSAKVELTETEKTELRTSIDSEASLTSDIELALGLEKRAADEAAAAAKVAGAPASTNEKKELRKFSISKLVSEYSERGATGITGFEKEMIEESAKEARALGVTPGGVYLSNRVMNVSHEKRTMTAATDADGGYLIPTVKVDFFDALFAYSVLDKLGISKLTGLSANTDIPGITSPVVVGWADGETGTQSPDDPTIANRSLRPKLLYGATNVSKRLMIQTNNSVDAMVMADIMKGLAQALQVAMINGSGASGQPTGIIGTSGIGSVAMGTNGAVPSLAKILELIQVVESANGNVGAGNGKFLINPKVKAKLKQTPIDTGSGAMIMPYGNYFGGADGFIDGYEAYSTSSVPSNLTKGSASGICSAVLFGDFSQVVLAQFGGVDIIIDPYTLARTGSIALTVNQYVDIAVKQPAALGAILDVLTT